jgi:flagellar assembly factor FliW
MTSDAVLVVESVLLGPLEIRTDTVIIFADGIPGFEQLRRFALIETQRDELVWLQSLDDAALTLLLADPFSQVPGFELDIPVSDLASLGVTGGGADLLVLSVAQLESGTPVSVNLQSPIVINRAQCIGRQVVIPDSSWGMHHAIAVA